MIRSQQYSQLYSQKWNSKILLKRFRADIREGFGGFWMGGGGLIAPVGSNPQTASSVDGKAGKPICQECHIYS